VIWSKRIAPAHDPDQDIGTFGHLALGHGKLYFRGGSTVPSSLDLDDGTLQSFAAHNRGFAAKKQTGKEIAVVNDHWLLAGGRRNYGSFEPWVHPERGGGFSLYKADRDLEGKPRLTQLGARLVEQSITCPVFDDEIIVVGAEHPPRSGRPGLAAYPVAALTDRAGKTEVPSTWRKNHFKNMPFAVPPMINSTESLPSGSMWPDNNLPVFASVVCANGVLVVIPKDGDKRDLERWQLALLNREDGEPQWTIDLPCRPAWEPLSVAPDGTILVPLWNGSVHAYR
jgi:hypothetical protein